MMKKLFKDFFPTCTNSLLLSFLINQKYVHVFLRWRLEIYKRRLTIYTKPDKNQYYLAQQFPFKTLYCTTMLMRK